MVTIGRIEKNDKGLLVSLGIQIIEMSSIQELEDDRGRRWIRKDCFQLLLGSSNKERSAAFGCDPRSQE